MSDPSLTHLVRANDAAGVRSYLDAGGDPDACDEGRPPPLTIAIQRGAFDISIALLAAGADPDRFAPLCVAAANGDRAVVQALLERDANPEQRWQGLTPFLWAAQGGHLDVLLLLTPRVDIHARSEAGTPSAGWNAVTLADSDDHSEVVDYLIAQGVDPSEREAHGRTPLHRAAESRDLPRVRKLLEEGGDPNVLDAHGFTPLHEACYAWEADPAVVRALLDAGADPDLRGGDGGLPALEMTLAQEAQNHEIFRLLAEAGADMNVRYETFDGVSTIAHRIAWYGDPDFVTIFADHGGDLDARDARGRTPLHEAVDAWNAAVVEALLSRGVDASAKDEAGEDALTIAERELASRSDREAVETLAILRAMSQARD